MRLVCVGFQHAAEIGWRPTSFFFDAPRSQERGVRAWVGSTRTGKGAKQGKTGSSTKSSSGGSSHHPTSHTSHTSPNAPLYMSMMSRISWPRCWQTNILRPMHLSAWHLRLLWCYLLVSMKIFNLLGLKVGRMRFHGTKVKWTPCCF